MPLERGEQTMGRVLQAKARRGKEISLKNPEEIRAELKKLDARKVELTEMLRLATLAPCWVALVWYDFVVCTRKGTTIIQASTEVVIKVENPISRDFDLEIQATPRGAELSWEEEGLCPAWVLVTGIPDEVSAACIELAGAFETLEQAEAWIASL